MKLAAMCNTYHSEYLTSISILKLNLMLRFILRHSIIKLAIHWQIVAKQHAAINDGHEFTI